VAAVKHAGQGRVLIVGEHVGDRLQFYSEGGSACLPNFRLCVADETGKHDYQHACTDWNDCFWLNYFFSFQVKSLDPDEVIPWSFSDWRSGVDPVLDRAIILAMAECNPCSARPEWSRRAVRRRGDVTPVLSSVSV
jgi:hypothetical protein